MVELEERLGVRQKKEGNKVRLEVLIKWHGLPIFEFEATWEDA